MAEPCKASNAQANSDDELLSDVETLSCLASLRIDIYRWQGWYVAVSGSVVE